MNRASEHAKRQSPRLGRWPLLLFSLAGLSFGAAQRVHAGLIVEDPGNIFQSSLTAGATTDSAASDGITAGSTTVTAGATLETAVTTTLSLEEQISKTLNDLARDEADAQLKKVGQKIQQRLVEAQTKEIDHMTQASLVTQAVAKHVPPGPDKEMGDDKTEDVGSSALCYLVTTTNSIAVLRRFADYVEDTLVMAAAYRDIQGDGLGPKGTAGAHARFCETANAQMFGLSDCASSGAPSSVADLGWQMYAFSKSGMVVEFPEDASKPANDAQWAFIAGQNAIFSTLGQRASFASGPTTPQNIVSRVNWITYTARETVYAKSLAAPVAYRTRPGMGDATKEIRAEGKKICDNAKEAKLPVDSIIPDKACDTGNISLYEGETLEHSLCWSTGQVIAQSGPAQSPEQISQHIQCITSRDTWLARMDRMQTNAVNAVNGVQTLQASFGGGNMGPVPNTAIRVNAPASGFTEPNGQEASAEGSVGRVKKVRAVAKKGLAAEVKPSSLGVPLDADTLDLPVTVEQ